MSPAEVDELDPIELAIACQGPGKIPEGAVNVSAPYALAAYAKKWQSMTPRQKLDYERAKL